MLEVFGGDAHRSHLLLSMTKERLLARQVGATHFHASNKSPQPPFDKGGGSEARRFEEVWTGDYIFESEWQSFRTKKDRKLELASVYHECRPGRRKLAVKVVDIFGTDTMTIVEVTVGKNGGKR